MIDFLTEAKEMLDQMIEWRRDLHRHPELRFQEVRTAGIAARHLLSLGIETRTGVGKTGVVGVLKGRRESPVVLLRFDMVHAPPGKNDVEYHPKRWVMQACGHDTHVAMGLA